MEPKTEKIGMISSLFFILVVDFPKFPIAEKLPKDDDGFIKSFAFDSDKEILEFFDEYGFVVIKDVLSNEEIDGTIEEIWKEVVAMSVENVI